MSSRRLVEVKNNRLKIIENFKRSAPKVVTVAYERWQPPRRSNSSDLSVNILVFWKVVADERWSQGRFDCIIHNTGNFHNIMQIIQTNKQPQHLFY